MSGRVKRHVLCLQMLNRTKNTKLRKAILEYADADLISALCECAHNILLRSCIKRVTRRDDSHSSDVWSREETRSLSSDAQQDEEYKASKGHTRIRRR